MKPRYNNYQKNYNKQRDYETNQQQQAFDLTNRSFPPISANATITKAELNENIKNSKKVEVSTFEQQPQNYPAQQFSQNSKKQQQYNNYQRQQQQQFGIPMGGKYNNQHQQHNYQNGATVNYVFNNNNNINSKYTNGIIEPNQQQRPERQPYNKDESSSYYKRHQPSQHTLSSFLKVVDKNKFSKSKSGNNNNNTNNNTSDEITSNTNQQLSSTNNNNMMNAPLGDGNVEQLTQQAVHLHIDPSQLTVYTNPSAYNPKEFNTSPKAARFFVIKSYSEDDIHRSIKYNIWCSTEHGNRRLDSAYFKGDGQVPVYLFFSVNGSGHFCGMAEMQSRVDYNKKTGVWAQDKWRGCFQVKWIYVKDIPNSLLRNIKLENTDTKPVTN
jgi:hypothetical protein